MANIKKQDLVIDRESQTFWEGVHDHKLLLQHCDDCNQYIFYPRIICPHCFSDQLTWQETSGQGSIHSFTVVHKAPPQFQNETPFVVGIIELEEGVRMMSRIIGDPNEIAIDKKVSVVYEQINEEVTLPYFKVV